MTLRDTFTSLNESDDRRLRRLAAQGDPEAIRRLRKGNVRRGRAVDWVAVSRKWSAPKGLARQRSNPGAYASASVSVELNSASGVVFKESPGIYGQSLSIAIRYNTIYGVHGRHLLHFTREDETHDWDLSLIDSPPSGRSTGLVGVSEALGGALDAFDRLAGRISNDYETGPDARQTSDQELLSIFSPLFPLEFSQ